MIRRYIWIAFFVRAVTSFAYWLTWNGSPGATGYIIEVGIRGADGQIVWTVAALVLNADGTYSFTINGLNPDTTYYFRVIAYNGSNDSPPSSPPGEAPGGGVHTPGNPPNAPNLTNATGVSPSEIDLT